MFDTEDLETLSPTEPIDSNNNNLVQLYDQNFIQPNKQLPSKERLD